MVLQVIIDFTKLMPLLRVNDGLSTTTTPAKIASVKVKVNGFELLFLGASWLTIRSFGSWPTVASTDIHSMSGFL